MQSKCTRTAAATAVQLANAASRFRNTKAAAAASAAVLMLHYCVLQTRLSTQAHAGDGKEVLLRHLLLMLLLLLLL